MILYKTSKMNNKKTFIALGFILLLLLNSCGIYDRYYHKVTNNIEEFNAITKYIIKEKSLEKMDSAVMKQQNSISLKSACIYYNKYNASDKLTDSILIEFMSKYDLDRICLEKRNNDYYSMVIIFHKEYNPITGSSRTIDYDYGKSSIRDKILQGKNKIGGAYNKIIDSVFIYSIDKTPSFGQ